MKSAKIAEKWFRYHSRFFESIGSPPKEISPDLGLFMALFYFVLAGEAWAVMASLLGLLAHLLLQHGDLALLAAWAGNSAVLAWTHRRELRRRPGLKRLPLVSRASRSSEHQA